ncbi:MAG: flagellar biosynthesis anti-sigma factor FlgM [Terriglobales bacterium]|jgi:negative regulator of flagellin synthesis FlgM
MRIGLKSTDPSEISTERTATYRSSGQSGTSSADRFSGDTVSLSALTAQTMQLPEVRQGKVDSLRQSIASGEYEVDPQKTADAMLND